MMCISSRIVLATSLSLFSLALIGGARADVAAGEHKSPRYLYIWAGDQARTAPDFVAVIGFNEDSKDYGRVLRVAPVPTIGNEAHHMHLSADGNILACGGLLSLLKGQDSIFFFDVSAPDNPIFLKSTAAPLSAITERFLSAAGRRLPGDPNGIEHRRSAGTGRRI